MRLYYIVYYHIRELFIRVFARARDEIAVIFVQYVRIHGRNNI